MATVFLVEVMMMQLRPSNFETVRKDMLAGPMYEGCGLIYSYLYWRVGVLRYLTSITL